jgi:hypothetical protein
MQDRFAGPSDLVRRPPMRLDDNLQDRVLGAILSVTLIGLTVVRVGALVLLVGKFVF